MTSKITCIKMNSSIKIKNRAYTEWSILGEYIEINPIEEKLFNNDIFTIDEVDLRLKITESPTRNALHIPGVLVLKSGKTYGRKNGTGKLLYKVLPNDSCLPGFLVPYELKELGFSKVQQNLFVTVTFSDWEKKEKHPHAILNQVIGSVDVVENFYEYQIYCKGLNYSIQKFTKETNRIIKEQNIIENTDSFIKKIQEGYPNIEDRTLWNVFSIDPEGSKDFDDAFSILEKPDTIQVSVYIANVVIWMDALNLWSLFSKRVSTMYLPDKKRTMLPPILSDILCSLQERKPRISLTMDVLISKETWKITNIEFKNTIIKVRKNYVYEESSLLNNLEYNKLKETTERVDYNSKYLEYIKDSHDVVAYWAIFMNSECAKELFNKKVGIFRKTVTSSNPSPSPPLNLRNVFKNFGDYSGEYTTEINPTELRHCVLNVDYYTHITSPIRRIVDVLNMIKFQESWLSLSKEALLFYREWTSKREMEYINKCTRNIRKVQTTCLLLKTCLNQQNKIYEGYILEISDKCTVYFPELNTTVQVKINSGLVDFELYEKKSFKLYLFNDEETLKKKIRFVLE